MDINPEDETSYTTQYQEAFLTYMENEYCSKHRWLSVIKPERIPNNNPFPSAMASGYSESSFDPYDLSSADEDYLMQKSMTETTPGLSDWAARLLTAARFHLNSPPESPQNWGEVKPNPNEYHSDSIEISRAFWIPDIPDWWRHQMETSSESADLCNVAWNIASIIPHAVGVEASFSQWEYFVGWRKSKTTGRTIRETAVVRQFAQANNGMLAGDNPALDTMGT